MSFSIRKSFLGFLATAAVCFGAWAIYDSTQGQDPASIIVNDGISEEGNPLLEINAPVDVNVVIAPPKSDGEPFAQKAGTKVHPLQPALEIGESVTWAIVVLDAETGERLAEDEFTWTREE